ncbi:MAG TPA: DUF1549 domain-containing protein, partial [Planctomycetota bacterium]|nr:DUF1549 domain-containing protein [Planctomycetota bacterium]
SSRASAFAHETDPVIVAGDPEGGRLLRAVTPVNGRALMPRAGEPLTAREIQLLRDWIAAGAEWPEDLTLEPPAPGDWWSLREVERPEVPALLPADAARARTPIDAFIIARQRELGLDLAPEADRRTLIRRLWLDVIGLPPPPEEVDRFVADDDPLAWEKLVDRVLSMPGYGERWARHWLDVVHYADTHGYDKDQPRPNAWPYRDWVIRSLNEDKPYSRFVREQIAGDVLWPDTRDGIVALGFISAGPWDLIGHAEVPETKIDGMIARDLDRDDMVMNTTNAFLSLTAQCARCHDHKFDPITQADYFSLQAVFAALDRADRTYEPDPEVAARRRALRDQITALSSEREELESTVRERAGTELVDVEKRIAAAKRTSESSTRDPRFGYHSAIVADENDAKWVQVDLGESVAIDRIVLAGCHDDFNGIGAGFGFPRRFRIDVSDDPRFAEMTTTVHDGTAADFPNPGVQPISFDAKSARGRYVRVTATKLALRQNDHIFALAELRVLAPDGRNVARGAPVAALDSIEAPVRWARANLVDEIYPGASLDRTSASELAGLIARRDEILEKAARAGELERIETLAKEIDRARAELEALPPPGVVYAGTIHHGRGAFRGTGPDGGKPRVIRVLHRGDVRSPGDVAAPGVPPIVPDAPPRFDLPDGHSEGARRIALADWIVDPRNPLTWRSIVNRVWQYHFGQGIVDTPNDFGRMGSKPSHPELLDWLA